MCFLSFPFLITSVRNMSATSFTASSNVSLSTSLAYLLSMTARNIENLKAGMQDPEQFDSVVSVIPAFKFSIFLAVIESKYARDVDKETLEEAVKEVADMFLTDVIRKGKLRKHM